MNFKKIASITASILMAGMSMGFASAAAFPAPFVQNGVANAAIVYGEHAGNYSTDYAAAARIQSNLAKGVTPTGTTTINGEAYKFEKTSTKFHLGDNLTSVVSTSLDSDQLPTLLKDGKYSDTNNDEFDYTQKVTMDNGLRLTTFSDNDYNDSEPTVGMKILSGKNILKYEMDFTDTPTYTNLKDTDLPLMGKTYYVLKTSSSELTLLDSAKTTVMANGDTKTIDGKSVTASFVGSDSTQLSVGGETTNVLKEGETYKLNDGTYIGIKNIMSTGQNNVPNKVEFSMGSGKLILPVNQSSMKDVKMNDKAVDGLTANVSLSSDNKVSSITMNWNAYDDEFVTQNNSIVMPGFKALTLSYTGLNYSTTEKSEIVAGGDEYFTLNNFPMKSGTADINVLYGDESTGNFTGLGKDSTHQLLTSATDTMVFDGNKDDYFVATYADTRDAESYLVRATSFTDDGATTPKNMTTFEYMKDGSWVTAKADRKADDEVQIGNVLFTVNSVNRLAKTVNITAGDNVNFNTLYSKEGLKVYLPTSVPSTYTGTTNNATETFDLVFSEENKDEDLGAGQNITATLGWNSQNPKQVSVTDVAITGDHSSSTELGDSKVYQEDVYSPLATRTLYDKSGDQRSLTLNYHGSEVTANVYLASASATVSNGASSLGDIIYKDSEVSSITADNVIIVGGSCINTAAAKVLGVPSHTCSEAFTKATGVGAGQYLIEGFDKSALNGKYALVVAGYNAADTTNAANYLIMKKPDLSKKWTGTSATEATTVTQ